MYLRVQNLILDCYGLIKVSKCKDLILKSSNWESKKLDVASPVKRAPTKFVHPLLTLDHG